MASTAVDFLSYVTSRERLAQVSALTQNVPLFLPRRHILGRVLPECFATTLGVSLLFTTFLYLYRRVTPQEKRCTLAYRLTNIVVNAVLAVIGLYGEMFVLPQLPTDEVATYVQGLDDTTLVVTLMLGYQLWALVAGTLFVKESLVMMGHHIAVFMVAIMYLTFTNGFRYHAFYFAGIWEVSSIPLAIMNILREKEGWKERHPILFLLIRATFAFSFLILRIWIGTPRAFRYVTDLFVVAFCSPFDKPMLYHVFMTIMFLLSFFLAILQFYWAGLIMVMVVRNAYSIVRLLVKKMK